MDMPTSIQEWRLRLTMLKIYKIEIRTRFGPDVILVKGEYEPSEEQIEKIRKKIRQDIVNEGGEDSEYPYVKIAGFYPLDKIPTTEEYIEILEKRGYL